MGQSVKAKLIIGFSVVLLVLLFTGGLGYYNAEQEVATVTRMQQKDVAFLKLPHEVETLLLQQRRYEKNFFLRIGDPTSQRTALEKFKALDQQMRTLIIKMQSMIREDDDLPPEIKKFGEELAEEHLKYAQGFYAVAQKVDRDNSLTPQKADTLMNPYIAMVREMEKHTAAILAAGENSIDAVVAHTIEEAEGAKQLLIGCLVGGAVLAVAAALLILLSVTGQIARVISFAGEVASGKLDVAAQGTFGSEMAELVSAIQTMVKRLKEKMEEAKAKEGQAAKAADEARQSKTQAEDALRQAERAKREGLKEAALRLEGVVASLGEVGSELASQADQVSRGAQAQKERTAATATAMEEMNATVLEVAQNASYAAESADQAKHRAENGFSVVNRVVESINEVKSRSEGMNRNLQDLGQHAEGIGHVMNVITDIADQTNLLALNAAIEAARAGEAGRGFAVVADEVRKLAEKTMQATKQVGDAVAAIQDSTRRNIGDMDKAVQAVDTSTALAGEAGDALHEIVQIVESTTDQVRSIATAAEEQSAASEEINKAVEDIEVVSSETAAGMDIAAERIQHLTRLSKELEKLVGQLRQG